MICPVQKISYKTENTFLFNRPEPTKELNDACFTVTTMTWLTVMEFLCHK